MGRDPDEHTRVSPAGARCQERQVAPDVSPQIEEVGDQQDSRRPSPDAGFDPRRDIGAGRLQKAGLDDAAGEAAAQPAGDVSKESVRGAHAAAVPDDEEGGAP